ncbi:MAG: iron-containing redox enzyme family protein [Candidatus Thermoplasmatota archaeon]|nr:iron-containing redox enzyme family protein [Candidatus Thermoplasmatota archaeon]MCL5730693.1 iron-containing redox enzyme family protein [Candidatus Thermoplasmatota archaeon]
MQNEQADDFYGQVYGFVKRHPATNNSFIDRFAKGDISEEEFIRFSIEFFHFTREWPSILSTLLVNTPDENDAENLTTILVSELGDTDPKKRHELLYRKYLRSIGIDPGEMVKRKQLPTTKAWLDGMRNYFAGDHFEALGAEFGLENMAIPMWDKLIPGLEAYRKKNPKYRNMDIEYFTFHRELEIHHEEAMADVLGAHKNDPVARERFRSGADGILNLEEKFWLGLSSR